MTELESTEGSIVKVLAKFIRRLAYDDLPEKVAEITKTRLLDMLSCALAGCNLPHSRVALELARKSRGDSTIIGRGLKVATLDAALVNGVLAHSILQEDRLGGIHPNTFIVPAAIAVAEQEKSSGVETLLAIVIGYELTARVTRACRPLAAPLFRMGPVIGTLGAAGAAGRLMKLTEAQLAHALGYAASLPPAALSEGWRVGSMEAMFEAGMSARVGILSAMLAKAGAIAAPEVLEGRHGFLNCWAGTTKGASLATDGLGKTFAISEILIKPYPSCGQNQLPIQTASLLAKYQLRANDITKVIERVPSDVLGGAGNDFAGPFNNQFQAQMSGQFCAAAAILGKPVASFSFFAEHYDDPEVAELAPKVEIVREQGRTKPRFEVYASGAKVYTAEEDTPDLTAHIPTKENVENKFKKLTSHLLDEGTMRRSIDMVMNLDKLGDIRTLTKSVVLRHAA